MSELASLSLPYVENQLKLGEAIERADWALQIGAVIADAIDLDSEHVGGADVDVAIIDKILSDESVESYLDPETKLRWNGLSNKQRKSTARILSLILNSVGGILLLSVGLPWLAVVLDVLISAAVESVVDEIEDGLSE